MAKYYSQAYETSYNLLHKMFFQSALGGGTQTEIEMHLKRSTI